MSQPVKILGIAGSLRKQSFNRGALHAAQTLVPEGATLTIFELDDIPIFNQDKEKELPPAVAKFKQAIHDADAILFVTPEYNYSIPGVLKNAIDWGSRPYGNNSWTGKPAAIMGASPGLFGSARAQYHLRQVLVGLGMPTVNQPEIMISSAADRFDASGVLTDEKTKALIGKLLKSLVTLTLQSRPTGA